MTATWGASEWITVIILGLGMMWIATKILGLIWRMIRAPFVALFYYFVDERVFAGVNPLEGEWDEEEDDRPGSIVPVQRVEPQKTPETYQPEPSELSVREPARDPLIISHNMSRKELTILLAAQKTDEGAYRWSANKIAEFVGGTAAEVKGWVADVRGKREPAAHSLRRPANGWR